MVGGPKLFFLKFFNGFAVCRFCRMSRRRVINRWKHGCGRDEPLPSSLRLGGFENLMINLFLVSILGFLQPPWWPSRRKNCKVRI